MARVSRACAALERERVPEVDHRAYERFVAVSCEPLVELPRCINYHASQTVGGHEVMQINMKSQFKWIHRFSAHRARRPPFWILDSGFSRNQISFDLTLEITLVFRCSDSSGEMLFLL